MRPRAMRLLFPFAVAAALFATPVQAQSELEKGFAGAVRGCEEWVLNPASWIDGTDPFISAVGLGDMMALVETVEEVALPPEPLRLANHYWRINSTEDAYFVLVVSDRLPMCHITGSGDTDLQPVVKAVLASSDFQNQWEQIEESSTVEMETSVFLNREHPSFQIVISRAKEPGQRLDRVQMLATAVLRDTRQ